MKRCSLVFAVGVALFGGRSEAQVIIGGAEYKKLDSRQATYDRMINIIAPQTVRWGEWHMLQPFPYAGHGRDDLKTALAPEQELSKMRTGGDGPDLSATYEGKNGQEAVWKPIGDIANRAVNFGGFNRQDLDNDTVGYLYGTLTVDEATTFETAMGSDDGLRFWLNGRLLVDQDVPRGLNPEEVKLKLNLEPGVNHVLAKVSQGGGSWQFQIAKQLPLDPQTDAMLQYHLDLDFPPSPEFEHYRAITIPVPEDIVLEVGGLATLPDGRPIVSTRRGEVWIVEGAYDDPPANVEFKRFAYGLHEPLGTAVREENGTVAVYCVQRGELTRLIDEDGDDVADLYETVCDDWGVSGNYHEFAFGPKFDDLGNAWVTLNVGFCGSLGKAVVAYRGWALKITPSGEMVPVCDGLRSPNGIEILPDGTPLYVDNQGDYVGTNRLNVLAPGSWAGHIASLRWRDDWEPGDPKPARQPASVWFPYRKMGQSTADILYLDAGGKFGPYDGQLFVGDQTLASVMRVSLEVVGDHYQGACYPFREGLDCGVNRLALAQDGSMLVGQTDRGWGSIGRLRYGLQRLVYTGDMPFELLEMRVLPDGFQLEFTEDLDETTATDVKSYSMSSYTYEYHQEYGSDEMETQNLRITGAELVGPRTVRISVDGLRYAGMGYVHELHLPGVRNADAEPPLHDVAYYTLMNMPQ
jgi:hypothetical protein